MDGGGSLAWSVLRSLRPQTDLKAAAVGAAVLLREWAQRKHQERLERKRLRPRTDLKAAAVGAAVLLREWVQRKHQKRLERKPRTDLKAAAVGAAVLLREWVQPKHQRLERKPLRPRTDLKAAAVGAAVLLREWVQPKHQRLERKPLRPRTDLKSAAVGAAVLLRQWVQQKYQERVERKLQQQSARAKAFPEREVPLRVVALVERYLPQWVGICLTVLLLCGSAGFGIVKGGHLEEFVTAVNDSRNSVANAVGFRIASVMINGRKQLSQDEVLGIGGVSGRSSLLFLNADAVRDRLKANPWIADATVLKLYPGQLQIDITERSAFALWQEAGRLAVIAEDGVVLQPYVSRRFLTLPLVVGKGAETRARDFLALLARYPQVNSVTRAAILIGERRWNLRLKDGLDIRLPEQDVGPALATLSRLDKEDQLFSRDIVAVDMRLSDRLVVQLSDDAAKAREELFKDKKPKKKAGDA